MLDEIPQQLALGRRVDRNRDGTDFSQSPHDEKEVRTVGQHHRHVLAFRYPQRAEAVGVTVRHLVQVCIRVTGVLPEEPGLGAIPLRLIGQQVTYRSLSQGIVAQELPPPPVPGPTSNTMWIARARPSPF